MAPRPRLQQLAVPTATAHTPAPLQPPVMQLPAPVEPAHDAAGVRETAARSLARGVAAAPAIAARPQRRRPRLPWKAVRVRCMRLHLARSDSCQSATQDHDGYAAARRRHSSGDLQRDTGYDTGHPISSPSSSRQLARIEEEAPAWISEKEVSVWISKEEPLAWVTDEEQETLAWILEEAALVRIEKEEEAVAHMADEAEPP
ncbi:hypothetical protein ACP4OV_020520 [Aristida adscensionis]